MTDKKKSSAVADMIEGSRPRRHSISGPETAPLVIRAKKEETERGRSSPLRPKELKRTETESRIPRSPRASSSSLSSYNALIRNAAAGTKKKVWEKVNGPREKDVIGIMDKKCKEWVGRYNTSHRRTLSCPPSYNAWRVRRDTSARLERSPSISRLQDKRHKISVIFLAERQYRHLARHSSGPSRIIRDKSSNHASKHHKAPPLPEEEPSPLAPPLPKSDSAELRPSSGEEKTAPSTEKPPSSSEPDARMPPVQYAEVDGKKVVVAASLSQIIELMAGDNIEALPDNNLMNAFLLSHQYFVDSKVLLEALIARYNSQSTSSNPEGMRDAIRIRIIKVLKKWIDDTFLGFHKDPCLVEIFRKWAETASNFSVKDKGWIDHLSQSLKKMTESSSLPKPPPALPPAPIIPPSKGPAARLIDLDDVDPLEVARQMTIIEHRLFRAIQAHELFRCAWAKENRAQTALNVLAMTERFNKISYWVATEIVSIPQLEPRVQMLARFIQLAEHLLSLNNFNSVMAIYCALNMGAVQRLKKTWQYLPDRFLKKMKEIDRLLDCASNFKNYRETLARTQPPLIPLQAVLLSDLTSSEEIPDNRGPQYNVEKMRVLAKIFHDVDTWQQSIPNLAEVPFLADLLQNDRLPTKTEEELYALSKICTTNDETAPPPKLKKLASSTPPPLLGIKAAYKITSPSGPKQLDFLDSKGSIIKGAEPKGDAKTRLTSEERRERRLSDSFVLRPSLH